MSTTLVDVLPPNDYRYRIAVVVLPHIIDDVIEIHIAPPQQTKTTDMGDRPYITGDRMVQQEIHILNGGAIITPIEPPLGVTASPSCCMSAVTLCDKGGSEPTRFRNSTPIHDRVGA